MENKAIFVKPCKQWRAFSCLPVIGFSCWITVLNRFPLQASNLKLTILTTVNYYKGIDRINFNLFCYFASTSTWRCFKRVSYSLICLTLWLPANGWDSDRPSLHFTEAKQQSWQTTSQGLQKHKPVTEAGYNSEFEMAAWETRIKSLILILVT